VLFVFRNFNGNMHWRERRAMDAEGAWEPVQRPKQESGGDRCLHDVRGTFATRCMVAGMTDNEIANILGWATKDVARIQTKYVSSARVLIAIGERIAAVKSA
jgi:integrase